MSSPENVDPIDGNGRLTDSPDETIAPQKTRYGRIIVKKGNLPGEDQIPKERRKKGKREEPIKPKRKYTKRKEFAVQNEDKDETKESKKTKEMKKKIDMRKEVKEEEMDEDEYDDQKVEYIEDNGQAVGNVPETTRATFNEMYIQGGAKQSCNLCGEVMEEYKMDRHLMEVHPHYAPYECLSCRIRFFFDYWELKDHYKLCSNNRIACDSGSEAPLYMDKIEALFFLKLHQPVECPFCRIYLATFFDLDVHFNAHGLCAMDAKFACNGCRITFPSVDALKRHLTKKNTPQQSSRCFNTGRSLNRREIEKLKERFTDADRKECMGKNDSDAYVLAPPKILECVQESVCAFCDVMTKSYAHIKTDLSNLINYGLECDERTEKEIIQKIKDCRSHENGRISLCRNHFQWRNWKNKDDKMKMSDNRVHQVIRRKNDDESIRNNRLSSDPRAIAGTSKNMDDHCYTGYNQNQRRDATEDEMARLIKKEIKEEVDCWDERNYRDRHGEDHMEYDVIDISDDDDEMQGEQVALPLFMDRDELEEKMSSNLKIAYTCPVCENSYPTLLDLHNHQTSHPEARLVYVCADCPEKTFPTPDDINKHFDEKMSSAIAAFYSFKVIVQAENSININESQGY